MRRIAIIPARGGSKRLPKKNTIDFFGEPIIAYTIQAALQTELFEKVCVSTDDERAMEIAYKSGAVVLERSAKLATDTAQVRQVCQQVLEDEEVRGCRYDVFSCLYATAPLRNSQDISEVVSLVVPGECDFALAVTEYDYPPHQALAVNSDGSLSPKWPDLVNLNSNDVEKLVVDNGSTYAVSVSAFKEYNSFYGPQLKGHVMPRERSIDIDYPVDLELAQFFANRMKK
jgi:CMP-N-acetylneuraminic acid synthetase